MVKTKGTFICFFLVAMLLMCALACGLAAAEDEGSSDDKVSYVYINNGETFEVNLSFGGLGPSAWQLEDYDTSYLELVGKRTWQDPQIAGYNDSWEQMIWTFRGLKDGEAQLRFDSDFREDDFEYGEVFVVTIGQGSNQLHTDNVLREADSGSCLHFEIGEEFAINFTWGEEDGYFFSDILFDNTTLELIDDKTVGPFGNSSPVQYYRILTFKALKAGKTDIKFMRADTVTYTYTIYMGTKTVAIEEEEKETPGFEALLLIAVIVAIALVGWNGRKITS